MKNYFKINYIESVLLIVLFIAMNFFNIIIRNVFYYFKLNESMIFAISYTIPFILLFIFVSNQAKRKNLVVDLSLKISPWYVYCIIILMMFSAISINEYLSSLVPRNGPILGNMYKEIEGFLKEEIKNPIPFFSTTVLLAPICEEVFFRGIILNGMLNNNIHPIKSIIFSSLLFGITHMNPWQFIGGLFIGILIGFVYFATSSIIDCIFLHIINNVLAISNMFFSFKEQTMIISEKIGIKNYYLFMFIIGSIVLIIGGYILMIIKQNREIQLIKFSKKKTVE